MLTRLLIFFAFAATSVISYAEFVPDVRSVDPVKLAALINQADKIVVTEERPEEDVKELFSSTAVKDIAEFNAALTIVAPENWFVSACFGYPIIRLYRGDTKLVSIANHAGRSVSVSIWTSDALLKNSDKWLKWFDDRNMPEVRKEFDELVAREKQGELAYAQWLAATPSSVRPILQPLVEEPPESDLNRLRSAVAKEFPDIRQRTLALFSWFGSGSGPWSGFPSYETIAEALLLDIPTAELIAAGEADNLTEAQLEGAARLFAGWDFSQQRPDDLEKLPATLKIKLLKHALKSTNEDNRRRAIRAFDQALPGFVLLLVACGAALAVGLWFRYWRSGHVQGR